MKKINALFVAAAVLLGLAALAWAADKSATPTNTPPSKTNPPSATASNTNLAKGRFPIIGYLEGQDKVIIIKSGPKGPLYSVKDSKGKAILEDRTMDQLRAQAPEIHQLIQSAIAANTRGDASLRMLHR